MNRNDLKGIIQLYDIVIIYITASWCTPCKKTYPIINNYSKQYDNHKLLILDYDNDKDAVRFLRIRQVPVLIGYKNQEKHDVCLYCDEKTIDIFFKNMTS